MASNDGLFKTIVKLEYGTPFGKANMATVAGLLFVAVVYFGSDAIKQLIFGAVCAVKVWVLKQNFDYYYNESNFFMLMLPTLIIGILCLSYMAWYNYYKDNSKRR